MNFTKISILIILIFFATKNFSKSIYSLLDSAEKYSFLDYDKSKKFAIVAYQIALKNKNDTLRGRAILRIGIENYLEGKHDIALKKYYNAEKIFQSINDKNGIAQTYNEMGVLYVRQNKITNAKQVLIKALELAVNSQKKEIFANAYNNLGLAYEAESKNDSAEYCFKNALQIYQNINDKFGASYSLDYLSSIYLKEKRYSESEQALLKSLQIKQIINDRTGIAIAINNLGELYLDEQNYPSALKMFKEAQDSAKLLKYLDLEMHTLKMQATVYENLNDFKNALYTTQQFSELNKKIQDDKRLKNIEEFQTKYNVDKKENEIIQQKLKLSRRNILLFSLIIILLFAFLSFYLFYNRKKLQQEKLLQGQIILDEQKRRKAIIEAEENEKERIARELHDGVGQLITAARLDLSNTINNDEIPLEQNKRLKNLLSLLDDSIYEIRNISHNMVPDILLKSGLEKAVDNFTNKINRHQKITISFECIRFQENSLDPTSKLMLYRIIQESVNNTLKYAEATQLDIQLSADDKEISLLIVDNGKGFDIQKSTETNSIGLKNMQLRTQYLKGYIEINSLPQKGTTILIEIPLT
jgi:two-component system NarL family sensor kinase